MFNLKTILSLLALGSVVVDNPVPQKLIKKAICVIGMIVFSCIAVGALLLAAIIYGFQAMVDHGYTGLEAGGWIVGGLAALAAITVFSSVCSVRKLIEEMKFSLKKRVPLTSHLTNEATSMAEAFFKGLMSKKEY